MTHLLRLNSIAKNISKIDIVITKKYGFNSSKVIPEETLLSEELELFFLYL